MEKANDSLEIDTYFKIHSDATTELYNIMCKRERELVLEKRKVRYQTYLMFDGSLYKIGKSVDPIKRLKQLKTGNPNCELICYGEGVDESYLHDYYFRDRVKLEWFKLTKIKVENIKRLITNGQEMSFEPSEKKYGWRLSDGEKVELQRKLKKSMEVNKKYKIDFGKYNGLKITEMSSPEQVRYCEWIVRSIAEKESKNTLKHNRRYKAFKWWLGELNKLSE